MITLKESHETELVIKKSRFIGYVARVENEAEAAKIIEQRKKEHYDARHNCSAWLLENGMMRYSDDGEPQGTAGIPMLEVLKKSGLQNVIVVCTRYFGGTLLGAGGLVRAYTQSAAQTLDAAPKVELVPCSIFACDFDFATFARVQTPLLHMGCLFDDIEYADTVRAQISITNGQEEAFLKNIQNLTLGQTVPQPLGTRRMPRDI